MSGDIHSIDFYKKIAMSKADLDGNGEIDNDTEQSIFNQELNKFDMNKDGKLDELDIPMFKDLVTLNSAEKKALEKKEKFDKAHPDFDPETATAEEIAEYNEIMAGLPAEKINKILDFNADVASTTGYFKNTGDIESFNTYSKAVENQIENGLSTSEDTTEEVGAEVVEDGTLEPTDESPITDGTEPEPEQPVVEQPVVEQPAVEQEVVTPATEQPAAPITEQPTPQEVTTPAQEIVVQTQPQAQPQQPARRYNPVFRTTGNTGNQLKTLDQMTLSELNTEKDKRVGEQKDKQSALQAVQNNTNEKVKEAKAERDNAHKEYEKSLKEDKATKIFSSVIIKNRKEIDKNLEDIDKNANDIIEKEAEIGKNEEELKASQSNLSALERALSALPKISGKEEDKKQDDAVREKQKSINKQISRQKSDIEKQEKKLEKSKLELEELQKKKETLDKQKEDLEKLKAEIDELVKKYASDDVKSKLEAFNEADKNFKSVKSAELQSAQAELKTANDAVIEVNEKIAVAKERETLSKNSVFKSPDINAIPEADRERYGVHEVTLPDGSKVLACRFSQFDKAQPEWMEQQQHILKAADELGLTVLYSDVTRTVAASNAARANKGSIVAAGGSSPHNYGVAVDLVLYKDGQAVGVNSELQTEFARKAIEYSGNKIEWGGEWDKKGERHHFELRDWENTYKSPEYLVG